MTDEQVLTEAMGMEWHEPIAITTNMPGYAQGTVCLCGEENCKKANPDFTSGDILWRVLTYMMGREDAEEFDDSCFWQYLQKREVSPYTKWLLTTPPDGKVRLVPLAAQWCREHGGGA